MSLTNMALRAHEAIRQAGVAIDGVSIGRIADKTTWHVTPAGLQAAAQATINAFDTSDVAQTSRDNASARVLSQAAIDANILPEWKALRGAAAVLVDEVNTLRQWITAFKVATAAATTLADFKTRVAALDALPDRTLAQAKTAIKAKIQAGTVD